MGRDDDIVALPQGMALGQRLGIGHVDPNAGEMLGLEPPHDGIEIVEAAAAYGDEVGALLQQLELFRSHHLVAHRRVGAATKTTSATGRTVSSWSGFTTFLRIGMYGMSF